MTQLTIVGRTKGNLILYRDYCPQCQREVARRKPYLRSICKSCATANRTRHGLRAHPLYKIWVGIKTRCQNPKYHAFHRYGGRGISVAPIWDDPAEFIRWGIDSGWRSGLQIDRIDNNGDYSPENCRFVTVTENSRNTGRNRITAATAARVKELLSTGIRQIDIARDLNVPSYIISQIATGCTWRDIP